ncbi:hypothetical protein IEQ34_010585 [Dendrobium chrysotoxum]|uniref:Trimethylguanosine synthase n=1 Tax=Dendrobium chrysotoxum TaxID=161865 RepID=A0AAV7GV67_DENCH|nr:hypothetical protein IEQ34_010585 [Dendrobium chrysotoxum]
MDALGLPLSFGTSKAGSNVTSRSKRNGTKPKFARHEKERNNPVPQIMVFSKMENPASSTYLHSSTNMSSCLHAVEGQVDTSCHDAKEHGRGDLHLDESVSASALGGGNETVKKPFLYEVSDANSENLDKFEFSPDTVPVSFQLNAEVLGSLSLHGDSCPEEILGDVCSQALFHHDGDLVNKHDLDRFSEDSSSLCCNMHLKGDTQTWQSSVLAEFSQCTLGDCHDNFICCEHGDWRVIWDPFYKSNYFVNVETLESTWYPPPGLEEYAFPCSDLSRKETDVVAAEKDTGNEHSCGFSVITDSLLKNEGDFHFTDEQPVKISAKIEAEMECYSHYTIVGNGNSNVQLSLYPSIVTDDVKEGTTLLIREISQADEENECKDLDEQKEKLQGDRLAHTMNIMEKLQERTEYLSDSLVKYWRQRYSLFSRFDYGIKMDEESWFSVTPELIAKHHAVRCGPGTIIDCFTGVGGNAIQFAMRSNHVIAIDVDPQKIEYAQQNAVIYEVSERIDFIKGDFFEIAPSLKGDVVFLSPPWGGPDYAKMQAYDMSLLRPRDGYYLFKIASRIAAKVVMFLPRNVNLSQLVDLSMLADPPWNLEVENNYLNGKLKSITAYFDKTTTD